MAIALGDNIGITGPLPTDNRYFSTSTNKPWTGVTEVNAALAGGVGGVRYTGLTVNVAGTEYWYKDGIEDGDLILKTTGGGSATSGENVTKEVTQASHGFAVNDFIGWSGGTYNKAIANGLYDGEFVGIVTASADTNTFSVTQSGYISGLTGLVTDTTYFLSESTAGLITSTEPTGDTQISKAVLIANSTTSGWVLPYAGYVITSGTTGGGTVTGAANGLTLSGADIILGGALTGDTVIEACTNCFSILNACEIVLQASGSSTSLTISAAGTVFSDSNGCGIDYAGDYGVNAGPYTLTNAQYVTGYTTSAITSAIQASGGTLMSGSTVGGVTTYVDADTICAQSGLTFNSSLLNVTGCACVSNCMLIGNPTCSSTRALKVGVCGMYLEGNLQMENDKVWFIGAGALSDTGTRMKLFTNSCHAYFDFYDCLILRSGPSSSTQISSLSSGGTFTANEAVCTPTINATSSVNIYNGGDFNLIASAASTDSGDIVFYTGNTTTASEWARIWTSSADGCLLYRSACDGLTERCVWHSGSPIITAPAICATSCAVITSTGAIYTGVPSLCVSDTTTRGTFLLESQADQPTDFFMKVDGNLTWDWSTRNSASNYNLNLYSSTNGTGWDGTPILQFTTGGTMVLQSVGGNNSIFAIEDSTVTLYNAGVAKLATRSDGACTTGIHCATTCLRAPAITLTTGAASGCVLTSDSSGNATWATPAGGGVGWGATTSCQIVLGASGVSGDVIESYSNLLFDGNCLSATGCTRFQETGDECYSTNADVVKIETHSDKRGLIVYGHTGNTSTNYAAIIYNRGGTTNGGNYGLLVDAGYDTPVGSGRSHGIWGRAGNKTSGYNFGIIGQLDGANNGAGIVGSVGNFPVGLTDQFAGYFCGPVYGSTTMCAATCLRSAFVCSTGNINAASTLNAPTVCAATLAKGPAVCGTSCVDTPIVCVDTGIVFNCVGANYICVIPPTSTTTAQSLTIKSGYGYNNPSGNGWSAGGLAVKAGDGGTGGASFNGGTGGALYLCAGDGGTGDVNRGDGGDVFIRSGIGEASINDGAVCLFHGANNKLRTTTTGVYVIGLMCASSIVCAGTNLNTNTICLLQTIKSGYGGSCAITFADNAEVTTHYNGTPMFQSTSSGLNVCCALTFAEGVSKYICWNAPSTNYGCNIYVFGQDAGDGSNAYVGGGICIKGGTGGAGSSTGTKGGCIQICGGCGGLFGTVGGAGGDVSIIGGIGRNSTTDGAGGNLYLCGGSSSSASAGCVIICGGSGVGTDGFICLAVAGTVTTTAGIRIRGSASSSTSAIRQVDFYRSTTTASGGIQTTSGTPSFRNDSDCRLKCCITNTCVDALCVVDSIPVRGFNWCADGTCICIGYVAQEVLPVYDCAATHWANDEWSVAPDHMIPVFHRAIQQLSEKITCLQQEIETLKGN